MIIGIILSVIGGATLAYYLFMLLGPGVEVTFIPLEVHFAIMAVALVLLIVGILLQKRSGKPDKAPTRKNDTTVKTAAKDKPTYMPLSYFWGNHIWAIVGAVLIVLLVFLWSVVMGMFSGGTRPDSILSGINIFGIIVFGAYYFFAGIVLTMVNYTDPAFGNYHPTGKKVSATRAFLESVYGERGLIRSLKRNSLIYLAAYALVAIVLLFFDLYSINALIPLPLLLVSWGNLEFEEKIVDEFIAEKSNCKEWRRYVCSYCDTLIPGSAYLKTEYKTGDSYLGRETTTTTTTTTVTTPELKMFGTMEYIDERTDTYVDTEVTHQDYISTEHTNTHKYRCPSCKRIHNIYDSYTTRTNI